MKVLKNPIFITGLLLLIGLIVFFALGFGVTILSSGSMSPELKTAAIVLTQKVDYEDIRVGDIIQYKTKEYGDVMHRVGQKKSICLLTRGDANTYYDLTVATKDTYEAKVIWSSNILTDILKVLLGDLNGPLWIIIARIALMATPIVIVIKLIINTFKEGKHNENR